MSRVQPPEMQSATVLQRPFHSDEIVDAGPCFAHKLLLGSIWNEGGWENPIRLIETGNDLVLELPLAHLGLVFRL
jgi:hypothetical protein